MKTHLIHLHDEPFTEIASGSKKLERRLYDNKRQTYEVGDTLIFESRSNPEHKIHTQIIGLYRYENFRALFEALHMTFFPDETLDAFENLMHNFITKRKRKVTEGLVSSLKLLDNIVNDSKILYIAKLIIKDGMI